MAELADLKMRATTDGDAAMALAERPAISPAP